MHIDTGDCGIPISCLLTAASVHDSGVSLPLEEITSDRVKSLYTLMDSAYDSKIPGSANLMMKKCYSISTISF